MGFNVDDGFLFEGNPTSKVKVEIVYLDMGTDSFYVEYDADPTSSGGVTSSIVKTNSKKWKTAVFELYDVYFGKSDDVEEPEPDIQIYDGNDGEELIYRVVVTLGNTIMVTTNVDNDYDPEVGSLRWAINIAQAYDTITFDPTVFKPTQPAVIALSSNLPGIWQGNLTIDASNAGVVLDGSMADGDGLNITSNGNTVRGLQIINFPGSGILLQSVNDNQIEGNVISGNKALGIGMFDDSNNTIKGNYIGTDADGSQALGNWYEGIFITNSYSNEISQNLICDNGTGNYTSGITLHGSDTYSNTLSENLIGVGADQSTSMGNGGRGVEIKDGAHDNTVGPDNIIANNDINGIALYGSNTHSNTVTANLIGVGADQSILMGNGNNGIEIRDGAHNNIVGPDNTIANLSSYYSAIQIYGSDSIKNEIHKNSIYDKRWIGIDLWGGGNQELAPPVIIDFDLNAGRISGLAYPNALVEVYKLDDTNWSDFKVETGADGDGYFTIETGLKFPRSHLTASATDSNGNTSKFSLITGGDEGTTSLQLNNTQLPTLLDTFDSNELEDDNHIVGFWHSLWDYYQPLSELLDQVRYSGVKRFRLSINCNEVVGVDWSQDEFSVDPDHDEFINDLVANNIQLTYTLSFWDIGGTGTPCTRFQTEEEIRRYLDYVEFIIDHFGDNIRYYEIWNEPDNMTCHQGIKVDDYIELVRRTDEFIQYRYPDEYDEIKIQVGGTAGLSSPDSQHYLFEIIQSDIMPRVDVISWHPFYGESPEYKPDYYYRYPELVREIKQTAEAHGFSGEYEADEMNWRPRWDPDTDHFSDYSEITATKYWVRGILTNLGLDVTAGNLQFQHYWGLASSAAHNLSTVMAGNEPIDLPVTIQSEATYVVSYGFSLPNGDRLLAVWNDGIANDYDAGIPSKLEIPGFGSWNATGIDVLHGFEQVLETRKENYALIIDDFLLKDYPIIIRLSQ